MVVTGGGHLLLILLLLVCYCWGLVGLKSFIWTLTVAFGSDLFLC